MSLAPADCPPPAEFKPRSHESGATGSSRGPFERTSPWVWLIAGIVLCLPPMVVRLGDRLSSHTMENMALLSAQETWLRLHDGESRAWLVPSIELQPRIRKPPMLVWLHMLAWSDLDPATVTPEVLTVRARIVSVAMGVLLLASTFWIGSSLLGAPYGFLALLAAGSNLFLQRQARTASYDIHIAAWTALAVACAMWTMRPRLEMRAIAASSAGTVAAPSPRAASAAGWIGSALALAAAMLTKGPLPLAFFTAAVGAVIVFDPRERARRVRWFALAAGIACACTASWYVAIWMTVPGASEIWALEYSEERSQQPFWYYLGFLGLMVPWTLWLFMGVVHPFGAADPAVRKHSRIAFAWFAALFILLSIPGTKQQRYILPLVPAAGLLIARVFEDHEREARSHGRTSTGRLTRNIHWFFGVIASAILGVYLTAGENLENWLRGLGDWTDDLLAEWQMVPPLDVAPAVAVSVALLAIALAGWRVHARGHSRLGAAMIALWMMIATTIGWNQYSQTVPERMAKFAESARVAREAAGSLPLFALRHDPEVQVLNEEFRFYFNRLIRSMTPDELGDAEGGLQVLVEEAKGLDTFMEEQGFVKSATYQTDRTRYHGHWVRQ